MSTNISFSGYTHFHGFSCTIIYCPHSYLHGVLRYSKNNHMPMVSADLRSLEHVTSLVTYSV